MSPPLQTSKAESKAQAEALLALFKFQRILNQDQNGRRVSLLGTIRDEPAVFILERAAFSSDPNAITSFLSTLTGTVNLGSNDIYRWYMSNHSPSSTASQQNSSPDLKLNLIYPCTPAHIKKYTSQQLRYVIESPSLYRDHIKPYIERTQRTPARLDWIYNILDGKTEQEDVFYRSPGFLQTSIHDSMDINASSGFLLLPDLNWDRKTLAGLHLLALPQRRNISSLRDLHCSHISWLRDMLLQIRIAAARRGTELAHENGSNETMDPDQVKCYVHYQPTYYHFHVHVVHVMLEAEGGTQSVGKAWGLETLIAMLEAMQCKITDNDPDPGLDSVDWAYHVGEESELWKRCFSKLKNGEEVQLPD